MTGKDNEKVATHVIGIKCAMEQAKLLKVFYLQLGITCPL